MKEKGLSTGKGAKGMQRLIEHALHQPHLKMASALVW